MSTAQTSRIVPHSVPARKVGDSAKHCFFGYYNKTNFGPDDRRLLGQRVDMMTKDLDGSERADVGVFDLDDGDRFHTLGQTTSWNWQMGAQLQWLGQSNKVIFNTRAISPGGARSPYPDFRSQVVDAETGEAHELPLPVYVVAPDGTFALTVDYSRFMVTHRTIGYPATDREPDLPLAPDNDGIWRMEIASGESRMILSLAELRNFRPVASMDRAIHWITHMEVNPSGTRYLFIHRWTERVADETCHLHRLFTINGDGTDLRLLEDSDHPLPQLETEFDPNAVGTFDFEKSEYQISHPMWKSDDEVIVWGPHEGEIHYQLYNDRTGEIATVGEGLLTENGHMSYSRDGRWLLSDTYPDDDSIRTLFLYNLETGRRHDLGRFFTPPDLGKHNRCDLHPRWSRDNRTVCIDSVHEDERQMYILDVSEILTQE